MTKKTHAVLLGISGIAIFGIAVYLFLQHSSKSVFDSHDSNHFESSRVDPPGEFSTEFLSLTLPSKAWSCALSENQSCDLWECKGPDQPESRIYIQARIRARGINSLDDFKARGTWPDSECLKGAGKDMISRLMPTSLQDHEWLESIARGTPAPGTSSYLLYTIRADLELFVTFSVRGDTALLEKHFGDSKKSLRVFRAPGIE